jgi:hypothetical protein
VIDQFEELYTMTRSRESMETFIRLVTDAASDASSGVRVITTLRADFYDRPLEDPRLGRLVGDGSVTVLPPSRDELIEMIVSPAQAVGLRWEPGLPGRIADEVLHVAGGLPLLQYALTELVERRSGDLLTSADYERVHGVAGALASRAESSFRDLTPSQRDAARNVMMRLVTVDEDAVDTRRRVRRSELESIGIPRSDLDVLLGVFTSQRLLVADRDPSTRGPTVEVAHEALLREWPRLRNWVDDQRDSLILARRFHSALTDWETSGREDDYLLLGSRLAPYVEWAESASLTTNEADFYRDSKAKADSERVARRRRRRALIAVLAAAAVIASAFGVVAAIQGRRAAAEAQRAGQNAELAFSRELAASSINLLDVDSELSLLLGLEAIRAGGDADSPPIEAISALHEAVRSNRTLLTGSFDAVDEPAGLDVVISPDASLIALSGLGPALQAWDRESSSVLWELVDESSGGWFWAPHFSPDSSLLAVAYTRYWSDGLSTAPEMAGGLKLQ